MVSFKSNVEIWLPEQFKYDKLVKPFKFSKEIWFKGQDK